MTQELKNIAIDLCIATEEFNTRTKGVGDLTDLAASIAAVGVREPLLGKDKENNGGHVEIYAGFRRLEAAKLAGLTEVPVLVSPRRSITKQFMLELNLTENLQRENLNPIDEALGFARLQDSFNLSTDEICAKLGVKKQRVENRFRLLKLGEVVREAVHEGRITVVSALEIDRLPEDKQSKYVGIAESLTGPKLKSLVTKELEKLQKTIEGTEKKEPVQENSSVIVEHIRSIKQSISVICQGLGYSDVELFRVRDVNFRVLETEDLGIVAKLLDDCSGCVEGEADDDVTYEDKEV